MTPEQWEKISEIYHSALEIDSSERRRAFLEEACANDELLRREVESLLAANSELGDFIAEPVVKDIAPLMTAENAPAAVSLAGKSLGHYRIVSRIGLGGMGEVYLARDSKLNRQVAVKTLPVSFSSDPGHLRRFQTEAKAAATLNHPNVATIYSVEEIDNQPFITMEYVEGKSLDTFIPAAGLDLKTFLEWFIPLADALSHAHEKGIIHRDIKPGNIMITSEGAPKILDFGLAQIDKTVSSANGGSAEDSSTLDMTEPGQVFGTPSYMSPEQAEGRQVDHRSDIFSFGVVMYQALTGERPFKGDSYASIVSALMAKEPRAVSEIKPETPFLLSRLVMRCLCKERRKRFQSMREVRAILEEIKAEVEASSSLRSSSLRFLKSRVDTSRRVWIFAPLVLLAIVAASFALYRFFQDKPQPPISFENITLRKLSQTNNVLFAHITPDGKSIAYTTIDNDEGRSLWMRRVDDKNALQLLPSQSVQFWGGITLSPDGSQIYYISAEPDAKHGTLHRISSLGGAPRRLVETVNDLGSLSPDGSRVLYVRYGDRQMQLLSANAADGSDERVVYSASAVNYIFRDPQFSLDGKSIFFIRFEKIDGEEFWSLVEIPAAAGGGEERVILPLRKPRIAEIVVLKDGSGLLVNATDANSNLQQLFHVSLPEGVETRITNDLHHYVGISISDDGKTIVTAQRNTAKDIWTVSAADTNNARKLSNESNVNANAVWTPDGRIVFDALDNNRPHIWIMNGDGTGAQQLTPNDSSDYEPRVSPDGRFIVFTSKRTSETKIWRMNIDGSNPQLLTPVNGATYGPVITPDGQTVLFQWGKENQRVLGRVPLAGGEITEQPVYDSNSSLYAISPDGRQIAHALYDAAVSGYKVRVRPFDAAEPSTVLDIAPINFLLWTPDGKGLLYREIEPARASSSIVWLQPVSGGEPRQFLSAKPDRIFNLSLSADGKQILFVRGRFLTDAVMLTRIRSN